MLIIVVLCVTIINVFSVFADSDIVIRDKTSDDYVPCERGWYYFRENCYKREGRDIWPTALDKCKAYGADLASIHSEEEQDFIIAFLILGSYYSLWIGLNDRDNESDYKWTDRSEFNYTNWYLDEPTGLRESNDDCVYMQLDPIGTWNDVLCTHENEYICKMKENPRKKSPNLKYCSPVEGGGWKYKDSCYHIVTEMKSWQNAETYCKNIYKGLLLFIQDKNEDIFLERALPDIEKEIWIGLKIKDGIQQQWTSGWYVSFQRFNRKKKIEEGSCVARNKENEWITIPCSRKLPFICKVSKATVPVLKPPPVGFYCPNDIDNWKDFGGDYCYYFKTAIKYGANFFEARSHCQGRGGDLASIHSQEEADILHPFIENTGYSIYIGLMRIKENSELLFGWTDGSAFDYRNWAHDEPNRIEEECVEVLNRTMEWRDTLCDNKLSGYICSVKKIMSSTHVVDRNAGLSSQVSFKTLVGVCFWIQLMLSLWRTII